MSAIVYLKVEATVYAMVCLHAILKFFSVASSELCHRHSCDTVVDVDWHGLAELYSGRHITAIFQPHLYTRTRDFYRDFADALSQLDEVILTEIYPAREQPIEGVTSQLIYDNLRPGMEKSIIRKDDVLDLVSKRDFDVLVILGAGDLDNYMPQITKIIENKK